MGILVPIVAIVLIFGAPIVAIFTEHRRKIVQMQLEARFQSDNEWREEAAKLRAEINLLRDTSTRYDISLEDTLQRVEQRLQNVEMRTLPVGNAEERSQIHTGR